MFHDYSAFAAAGNFAKLVSVLLCLEQLAEQSFLSPYSSETMISNLDSTKSQRLQPIKASTPLNKSSLTLRHLPVRLPPKLPLVMQAVPQCIATDISATSIICDFSQTAQHITVASSK